MTTYKFCVAVECLNTKCERHSKNTKSCPKDIPIAWADFSPTCDLYTTKEHQQ